MNNVQMIALIHLGVRSAFVILAAAIAYVKNRNVVGWAALAALGAALVGPAGGLIAVMPLAAIARRPTLHEALATWPGVRPRQ